MSVFLLDVAMISYDTIVGIIVWCVLFMTAHLVR